MPVGRGVAVGDDADELDTKTLERVDAAIDEAVEVSVGDELDRLGAVRLVEAARLVDVVRPMDVAELLDGADKDETEGFAEDKETKLLSAVDVDVEARTEVALDTVGVEPEGWTRVSKNTANLVSD